MEWLLILSPVSVPLLAVVIVRHFAPGSLWLQLGAGTLGGSATGLSCCRQSCTPKKQTEVETVRSSSYGYERQLRIQYEALE